MSMHLCINCKYIRESIEQAGSAMKELILTCELGHARIWIFSGTDCRDYKRKLEEMESEK